MFYYIKQNNDIKLFDTDKNRLERTLIFTPQFKNLDIEETEKEILEFNGKLYFKSEIQELLNNEANNEQKQEILLELDDLDKKRIRAICENEIKDTTTGETWLEYYNTQAKELREKLLNL